MKHKHGLIGGLVCARLRPCPVRRAQTAEHVRHNREVLRAAVAAERARLYALIDADAPTPDDDQLLAMFARNGSTDKGRIRRAPTSRGI